MREARTADLSVPVARPASRGGFGSALRQSQAAYLLLAPYMVLFLVILAYPLLYSIYLSFFAATLIGFTALYGVLCVICFKIARRIAIAGPPEGAEPSGTESTDDLLSLV